MPYNNYRKISKTEPVTFSNLHSCLSKSKKINFLFNILGTKISSLGRKFLFFFIFFFNSSTLKNEIIDVSLQFTSFRYSTIGGLNDWGYENFFWKLISEGFLFKNGVENFYKTANKTFNMGDAEAATGGIL